MNTYDKGCNYRVFSITDRPCPEQPTGGPGGVNSRLTFANQNYNLIENMYTIFSDVVISKEAMMNLVILSKEYKSDNERLTKYFNKLNQYYRFTDDDVYIFHDVMSAFVFISTFHVTKTVLVYHQQGSLYAEWACFNGKQNEKCREQLNGLFSSTIQLVKYLAFPSKGAMQSVIDSEPALETVINNTDIKILYNGCDNPENVEASTDIIKQTIQLIQDASGEPIFTTVATLNEAKGVERIPSFLSDIKKKYGSFLWIVIGDGIKAHELEENINKYNLQDNVIWIKERVPHDDVLALFQYTDFYILAHRFSIFDFSTIEAMKYGNIPILTPIGGNKEIIIDDNGIFINDLTSCKDFDEYVANHSLDDVKVKNITIANDLYSEKAFIRGYADLVKELCKDLK